MRTWQLQEAKNKFSEVVERAVGEGPQVITRRGEEVAVIISFEDYRKLCDRETDLVTFFRQSPLVEVELDLSRDRSLPRDVEL